MIEMCIAGWTWWSDGVTGLLAISWASDCGSH